MLYGYDLDKAVEKYGFTPVKLTKNARHETGKTYWIGYWSKYYTVLAVNGREVTVKWQDGKINTHMTSLNHLYDWELKWPVDKT